MRVQPLSCYMCPYIHGSIIHGGQDRETTKVSLIDNWIKMWYKGTTEYYSALPEGEILPFVMMAL